MSSGSVPLEAFSILLAALVGLIVGSFLNVVVYRVPIGLSLSTPRSFCPTCDRQLAWWENIPVVTWLLLRGCCRGCHQPISARYPLVELSTGVVFAVVTWAWHGTGLSPGYCVLAATAIAVSLIELGGSRSPLSVAAVGTALGQGAVVVASVWLHRWTVLGGSLAGLAVGATVFGILRLRDPECLEPTSYGRTLLPVAGCWLGGLGLAAAVVGLAVGVLVTLSCLALVRWTSRTPTLPHPPVAGRRSSIIATPLVTATAAAMAVSLMIAA